MNCTATDTDTSQMHMLHIIFIYSIIYMLLDTTIKITVDGNRA